MGLSIDIAVEHDAWNGIDDLDSLTERAAAAAVAESGAIVADATELSLLLCDDAAMRVLNRTWRGQDKATNVLSFPSDPSVRAATLGDIVIAFETTAAEAEADGRSLHDHTSHLVVHGVLHLLGYDHETDAEAEAMERLETRALAGLGIASPHDLSDVDGTR